MPAKWTARRTTFFQLCGFIMSSQSPKFNPDEPKDVSAFLQLLFELHMKGRAGGNMAIVLLTELAASDDGRTLLRNAHRVVSAQIGKCPDARIFQAQLWIQKITGMFGTSPV